MPKLFSSALAAAVVFAGAAHAQDPGASQAQDLTNCAGAVAAEANIDVLIYPRGASGEWAGLLGVILDQLNREEGVEGMTGRYAASAARSHWAEQPADQRQAAVAACRARYAPR